MLNLRKLPEIPVRLMTVATITIIYNNLTKYFNELQCKPNSVSTLYLSVYYWVWVDHFLHS